LRVVQKVAAVLPRIQGLQCMSQATMKRWRQGYTSMYKDGAQLSACGAKKVSRDTRRFISLPGRRQRFMLLLLGTLENRHCLYFSPRIVVAIVVKRSSRDYLADMVAVASAHRLRGGVSLFCLRSASRLARETARHRKTYGSASRREPALHAIWLRHLAHSSRRLVTIALFKRHCVGNAKARSVDE